MSNRAIAKRYTQTQKATMKFLINQVNDLAPNSISSKVSSYMLNAAVSESDLNSAQKIKDGIPSSSDAKAPAGMIVDLIKHILETGEVF